MSRHNAEINVDTLREENKSMKIILFTSALFHTTMRRGNKYFLYGEARDGTYIIETGCTTQEKTNMLKRSTLIP